MKVIYSYLSNYGDMSEQQKSTDQLMNEKVFPAIILALSIITFILFFATDFGGWYIYGPEIYRYVWMFSEMVWWSFIWMLPLAGSFAALWPKRAKDSQRERQ